MHHDILRELQKTLQEMSRDGAIEQIPLKYEGNDTPRFKLYDEH